MNISQWILNNQITVNLIFQFTFTSIVFGFWKLVGKLLRKKTPQVNKVVTPEAIDSPQDPVETNDINKTEDKPK